MCYWPQIRTLLFLRLILLALLVPATAAMTSPMQVQTLKFALKKKDFEQCGMSMVRKAQTLTYTCELDIPSPPKGARLGSLISARKLSIAYGGSMRFVALEVASKAKVISLTTSFDATGLDLELSKFNDDFYSIYAQAAHNVISDALRNQKIQIELLESAP